MYHRAPTASLENRSLRMDFVPMAVYEEFRQNNNLVGFAQWVLDKLVIPILQRNQVSAELIDTCILRI